MGNKEEGFEKYLRAKNRVDSIKAFYAHVIIFIVGTVVIFVFKDRMVDMVASQGAIDPGFLYWMEWNIVAIPILWGLVLLFFGIYIFKLKPGFLKNWEKRKIEKYLKEKG